MICSIIIVFTVVFIVIGLALYDTFVSIYGKPKKDDAKDKIDKIMK